MNLGYIKDKLKNKMGNNLKIFDSTKMTCVAILSVCIFAIIGTCFWNFLLIRLLYQIPLIGIVFAVLWGLMTCYAILYLVIMSYNALLFYKEEIEESK